uniref:Uncharacterized protein n=1 Tax=Vitis vinifera TaxID=29760 RepID=F6HVE2_VITVI
MLPQSYYCIYSDGGASCLLFCFDTAI